MLQYCQSLFMRFTKKENIRIRCQFKWLSKQPQMVSIHTIDL